MTPHIIFKSAWEVSQRSDFKGGQKFKMFCGPRFAFDTFCDQWVVPTYFSISRGFTIVQGGIHTEGVLIGPPFFQNVLLGRRLVRLVVSQIETPCCKHSPSSISMLLRIVRKGETDCDYSSQYNFKVK